MRQCRLWSDWERYLCMDQCRLSAVRRTPNYTSARKLHATETCLAGNAFCASSPISHRFWKRCSAKRRNLLSREDSPVHAPKVTHATPPAIATHSPVRRHGFCTSVLETVAMASLRSSALEGLTSASNPMKAASGARIVFIIYLYNSIPSMLMLRYPVASKQYLVTAYM